MAILRDLAEVTHWVSMLQISPDAADDPTIGPDERARGLDFSARLGRRVLTRMWQMLLKTLDEVANAPNAMMAAEMAIIRLTHVAELPSPGELVRRLSGPGNATEPAGPARARGRFGRRWSHGTPQAGCRACRSTERAGEGRAGAFGKCRSTRAVCDI